MKGNAVSYAASFGDTCIDNIDKDILKKLLNNFKSLGLREKTFVEFAKANTNLTVKRVVDPTLLLAQHEYDEIIANRQYDKKYVLLYSRRYNKEMELFADDLARNRGLEVIEISLRATNKEKHCMRYDAGVEEFLSLVKHAEYVVTNSFHGIIFSTIFKKDFSAFVREEGNVKILELLSLLNLKNRLVSKGDYSTEKINYVDVLSNVKDSISSSKEFLRNELKGL